MRTRSLRQRIAIALTVFSVLVASPIIVAGHLMNEHAEEAVWLAMLGAELADLNVDGADGTSAHHGVLDSYVWRPGNADDLAQVPGEIASLAPGLHDEILVGGREWVVLVRDYGASRAAAGIDITELESEEELLSVGALLVALAAMGMLLITLNWLAGRAVEPVTLLSTQLQARAPRALEPFETPFKEREIVAVVEALNGFVVRMHDHVRRERQFVETMSHELRTPLAVILGAAELLKRNKALEPKSAAALDRIQHTAWDLSDLAQVLLFLSHRKGAPIALESVDLQELLSKSLRLFAANFAAAGLKVRRVSDAEVWVQGVRPLCEIVINNLIRNCCDHGRGWVEIDLSSTVLTMSNHIVDDDQAQQIAPPRWRGNAGIGMDLIVQICEQFGWSLDVSRTESVFRVEIRLVQGDQLDQVSV